MESTDKDCTLWFRGGTKPAKCVTVNVVVLVLLVVVGSSTVTGVGATDSSTPQACRANLCSDATPGLNCPKGSLLHVRNVTCHEGDVTCSPATFLTLYSLCEGRSGCDASGLRMLASVSMYCQDQPSASLRNVFVDYLCVPKSLIHSKCGGSYQRLAEPFGVLMTPGFLGRAPPAGLQCNWFLRPDTPARVVHVTVHMAYSTSNCTADFLQVRYKDCGTGESSTVHFCDLAQVNAVVTSCGPVHVSSWVPAGSDKADRFLVSYQVINKGAGLVTPTGMSTCSPAVVTSPPPAPKTTVRPVLGGRNYGPGGTMFDYSDTIRQTAEDAKSDEHSTANAFQFKLIILYVFFGVVILALIIALVYVLISYRGISRRGRHQGDSSEKAALWRHDDTPMDTFNHNSHASLADASHHTMTSDNSRTSLLRPSPPPPSSSSPAPFLGPAPAPLPHSHSAPADSQLVACTVHTQPHRGGGGPADDDDDNGVGGHRYSTGSGFSSFLSGTDSDFNSLRGGDLSGSTANPYSSIDGTRGGSLPRRWGCRDRGVGAGGGGSLSRSSTRSNSSFKCNGELSNIYEAIDHPQQHYANGQGPLNSHHVRGGDVVDGAGGYGGGGLGVGVQETSLVHPHPPPSPPLPPPPPPLALDDDDDANPPPSPSTMAHYRINNDDYALVSKGKAPNNSNNSHASPPHSAGYRGGGSNGFGGGRGSHRVVGGSVKVKGSKGGQGKAGCSPLRSPPHYTNLPCFPQNQPAHSLTGPSDLDFGDVFRERGGDVVGFRPTSGPYDRERSSRSEPVSPSSGGASRHRWDEV